MTQVNPDIFQIQTEPSPAIEKTKQLVAAQKGEAKRKRDTVARSGVTLPALKKGKTGVADDPLAAVPAANEQPNDEGQYYTPVGMPSIYYAMQALLLDLQSGLKIARIDNDILADQFERWAQQLQTYADKSRDFLKKEAKAAMYQGIGSIATMLGSAISAGGSTWSLKSTDNAIKKLTDEREALQLNRFGKSFKIERLGQEESQPLGNVNENECEIAVRSSNPEEATSTNVQEPAQEDGSNNITIQRNRLLDEKNKVEDARRAKLEGVEDPKQRKNINLDHDRQLNRFDNDLDKLTRKDKVAEGKIKQVDDRINAAQQKGQKWQNIFQSIGYMGQGAQGLVTGFSGLTIKMEQAKIDYAKNIADKLKQLRQMVTQAYSGQVDTDYRAVDQMLSALENSMRALYAAQQSGTA